MPPNTTTLENWLWEAACSIRGLPLLFCKRLYDVFDDELDALGRELGDRDLARWVLWPSKRVNDDATRQSIDKTSDGGTLLS